MGHPNFMAVSLNVGILLYSREEKKVLGTAEMDFTKAKFIGPGPGNSIFMSIRRENEKFVSKLDFPSLG